MKQKQMLIISIIVILAILACLTAFLVVNSNQSEYATLRISNSCTIDVPNVNNTMEHMNGSVSKYMFSSVDLNITHQKSGNNSQIKSMSAKLLKNSEKIEGDIYRDSGSGVYSIFIENKNTGDALLITSGNLDLLKKVVNSIKFSKPLTSKNNTTNTTDNGTDNQTADNTNTNITKNNVVSRSQSSNQSSSSTPQTTPVPSESSNSEPATESDYPSYIHYQN